MNGDQKGVKEVYTEPVFTIGIAAKHVGVCTATLRIWENKGLLRPARLGKNRFYSKHDIDRLKHIKNLIQKKKINIEGIKYILSISRCWEIKKCRPKERIVCPVYIKFENL